MEQRKIVILDGGRLLTNSQTLSEFGALGNLSFFETTSQKDIIEHIADNEIVLVDEVPIDRETIKCCPSIKMIGLFSTGYNHIDINAANEAGIIVCNAPKYSAHAVAQLTTALLLEIYNHVDRYSQDIHAGKWKNKYYFSTSEYGGMEVSGKTVGIIGYGCIGQLFGRIMKAMGAHLLVYSRHPHIELEDKYTHYASLGEIYEKSDIISLHCPLNEDSFEMINAKSIAKMKSSVVLINTARGALLNEKDVADALYSGKIYALGQDAFVDEPIPASSPLLSAPNTYLTPHIGWDTKESRKKLRSIVKDNVKCFITGNPQNVVIMK